MRVAATAFHFLELLPEQKPVRVFGPMMSTWFLRLRAIGRSNQQGLFAVRRANARAIGLRSAICTDAPLSRLSPWTRWCLRKIVKIPQI